MKKNKCFLITGVAGNIASSLAKFILQKNHDDQIIGVDNFLTGKKKNLPIHDRFLFFKKDVNKFNQIKFIFENHKIDYVFHYAACAGVERTLSNPFMVFEDVLGINNIAKLSVEHNIKKIVYASSSEVYGENSPIPFNEKKSFINPRLPYATVKAYGESVFLSLAQRYGLNCNVFRFFNTYGPEQSDDYVIQNFIKKAIKGEDLVIYGSGNQTRTFLYISDNLEATYNAFLVSSFDNKPINIGSKDMISIKDLAKKIIQICNSKSKIQYLPKRKIGDTSKRQPDNQVFKKLLNRNMTTLDDGLRRLLNEIY